MDEAAKPAEKPVETIKPQLGETVRIVIKDIEQLFNSLDPSPFIEKDLDDDAAEYITSYFSEYSLKKKVKILIQIPKIQKDKFKEDEIKDAIRNYFSYQKTLEENNIEVKIKEGQQFMIIGLSFLTVCLLAREYFLSLETNIVWNMLAEAFQIFGWVAMWKPISNLLYDWWPMKQKQNIYDKISKSEIDFIYT